MTEVGVDAVIPWSAERSITKWQGDRGERALAKWRATAREAAKQSRRAWLPEIAELASTAVLAKRVAAAAPARSSWKRTRRPSCTSWRCPTRATSCSSSARRAASARPSAPPSAEAGAIEARLGPTVLRTSTAGAAAAAILLSRHPLVALRVTAR